MEPSLTCVGISHHTAPLTLRERFLCSPETIYGIWRNQPDEEPSRPTELALLSTCNRFEIYALYKSTVANPARATLELLSACEEQPSGETNACFGTLSGQAAAEHLCRVAAGLESQVIGEAQILGQVISAYTTALEYGTLGPYLSALFQSAIRAGKRARAETAIGRNPISLGSAAIAAARRIFTDLSEKAVLVIGAGEMARLTVKGLAAQGVTRLSVANRTPERASRLAAIAGGRGYGLDALTELLADIDVAICATAAPHTVIDRTVLSAAARPPGRGLLLIDIALPRDVAPDVRFLPGVQLLDMDDLKERVDQSIALRQSEIPVVSRIIAEELAGFDDRLRLLTVRPVIVDLRQKAETIRRRELERAMRHLDPLTDETAAELDRFSRSLINKLLHHPTVALREKAGDEDGVAEYVQTVRELFDLGRERGE